MKHFDYKNIADVLICLVPLSLVVPNIWICILGDYRPVYALLTIFLPYGAYLLAMSVSRNTPVITVLMLPVMILAAFQIVVSCLYNDGSPIGVDMFLNVLTTNMQEVNELLSSICVPVIFVSLLYLPLLVAAVIGWRRHDRAGDMLLKKSAVFGLICLVSGGAGCALYGKCAAPGLSFSTELFPANAMFNLSEAVKRNIKTSGYPDTSRHFTYNARKSDDAGKELYIAVIGETSRADNWQLFGYGRQTNPCLGRYADRMMFYNSAFSESNTTHKSVPMLLSTISSENFKEDIFTHKSIITAFREAGFHTVFLSMQRRNHSFIEEYANEADAVHFLCEGNEDHPLDERVLPDVESAVYSDCHDRLLIVIHLYGSHYAYKDRYPADQAVFVPDDCLQANCNNRQALLNAYDNTIVHTDSVLHNLCSIVDRSGRKGALIYCSDHGEDIFDDGRQKFLHASPAPTYWQLHVPFLIYLNQAYCAAYPDLKNNAICNMRKPVSSSKSYAQTLLQLAGIATAYSNSSQSLVNKNYEAPEAPVFLNDRNEPADLMRWGFNDTDRFNYKKLNGENYD